MGIDFRGREGNVGCLVNLARGSSGAARQARGRAPRLVSRQRERERKRKREICLKIIVHSIFILAVVSNQAIILRLRV